MKVGIDAISFYSSQYFLDLKTLAEVRQIPLEKFYDDLGIKKIAVAPPCEDIVTLAANAVTDLKNSVDLSAVDTVIFATESGIDFSKSAGTYIHRLLNLPMHCRTVELKQACYSGTAGLQFGMALLHQFPEKKILLIASDIARYGLGTKGEYTQGAGAIAMLLSANPRLMEIEPYSGVSTHEVMDFWRPTYCTEAFFNSRLSCTWYIKLAEDTWAQYAEKSGRKFLDHTRFCYHVPVPRLVNQAHLQLAKINGVELSPEQLREQVGDSLSYSSEIGNCYTASLYLGLLSTLELAKTDLSGKIFGLYSYGSGAVAEYFSGKIVAGYQNMIDKVKRQNMLKNRAELSFAEYEEFHKFTLPEADGYHQIPKYNTGSFRLAAIDNHQRVYESC
ncbi:MAG: hydroxymethylglutaryl-CoA synthase [Gammaproteobacteria bacterium]|nr:hydroxymethylglutaryl-CoA synthase [Gammaproteobacteria bacterium]